MAYLAMNTATVYVTEETTAGVAVDPTLGSQAVSVTEGGIELNGEKELVERTNMTSSLVRALPRTGIKRASGSVTVEAKANSTEGLAPEATLLLESAFGGVRSLSSSVTTLTTTNLTTIPVSLSTGIAAGDIVMIKDTNAGANGYHVSPVTASAVNGTNDDTVTLLVPCTTAPSAGSSVSKFTTFYNANDGHPSLTITEFIGDAVKCQAAGMKVNSLSMEGFEAGQTATFSFGLVGMDYDQSLAASGLTASYNSALPPLALDACIYKDGAALEVTGFSFSLEHEVAEIQSTCAPNGIVGTRHTRTNVSGSFTAHAKSDSVALFSAFANGTEFSLFGSFGNPGASAGQKKEVIGFYFPKCIITAAPFADADGIVTYSVEFQCGPDAAGSAMYLGFI